eukprot:ctg_1990.g417
MATAGRDVGRRAASATAGDAPAAAAVIGSATPASVGIGGGGARTLCAVSPVDGALVVAVDWPECADRRHRSTAGMGAPAAGAAERIADADGGCGGCGRGWGGRRSGRMAGARAQSLGRLVAAAARGVVVAGDVGCDHRQGAGAYRVRVGAGRMRGVGRRWGGSGGGVVVLAAGRATLPGHRVAGADRGDGGWRLLAAAGTVAERIRRKRLCGAAAVAGGGRRPAVPRSASRHRYGAVATAAGAPAARVSDAAGAVCTGVETEQSIGGGVYLFDMRAVDERSAVWRTRYVRRG